MSQPEMPEVHDIQQVNFTSGRRRSGKINPKEYWTLPAEIKNVKHEKLKLSGDTPKWFEKGTRLAYIQTLGPGKGTPACHAFDPQSLVVKFKGQVLQCGIDYLVDSDWGVLGIGSNARITLNDEVEVDYKYSLLRIDSLVRDANGQAHIIVGKSDLTTPVPPVLGSGQKLLANIFVDYFSSGKNCEILKVCENVNIVSNTSTGLIPKTLRKLQNGQSVRIVCWGDSVTEGGDASFPEKRYTSIFQKLLRTKFPNADVILSVIAVGGSNSKHWLYPEKFKHPSRTKDCDFEQIIKFRPDLVTVEFVNDASLCSGEVFEIYSDIKNRVNAIDSEVIFITPHFTSSIFMNIDPIRGSETREYVFSLKEYARQNKIALADVSARWEHLQFEGVPYITFLKNGINHPDDRGHAIIAQELIKCFDF